MSLARMSLCLAGSALLSVACLTDEAAPSATAVPVLPTISRPPLVTPATVSPVPSPSPSLGASTYTVQDGDSLSSIAGKLYRDAGAWPTIYDANRDLLTAPDDLQVGQTLRIPPAPTPRPTSAVTQVVATAIAATSVPATAVPATAVPATAVPPTSGPAPATAVPAEFVPATGPTVIALTAAANPTPIPTPA